MYDTILVPLDGSRRAEAILPHVEGLAKTAGSKVVLLTSMEHRIFVDAEGIRSEIDEAGLEARTKEAESYLSALVDQFHQKDIQTEFKIVPGSAIEVILKTAEDMDANLIAIASHGRSGLGRVFYGSIAAGLLQVIDRPLLLVRSRGVKLDHTIQWGKDVL